MNVLLNIIMSVVAIAPAISNRVSDGQNILQAAEKLKNAGAQLVPYGTSPGAIEIDGRLHEATYVLYRFHNGIAVRIKAVAPGHLPVDWSNMRVHHIEVGTLSPWTEKVTFTGDGLHHAWIDPWEIAERDSNQVWKRVAWVTALVIVGGLFVLKRYRRGCRNHESSPQHPTNPI